MGKATGIRPPSEFVIAAFSVLLIVGAQPSLAATVAVGTCMPHLVQFTSIQSAVDAAPAGSTIKVCPGTYPEQVVINKKLTLEGINAGGADNPTLVIPPNGFAADTARLSNGQPFAPQILVESPATDVDIHYLTVDGSGNNLNSGCSAPNLIGIYYQNASGTIRYVVARNQAQNAENFHCQPSAGLGIFVESGGSGTSTVTIENCSVRGYQKNGITGDETGTNLTIRGNSVVGAGPTTTAQNGIQLGFGATGRVEYNTVADDVFNGDPNEGAASGILIFGSGDTTITGNSVTTTQTGINIVTDGTLTANGNTITDNHVANTILADGIDICSNDNTVIGNTVFSSAEAGIHLDSTCASSGNNNTARGNSVNEACAGILLGTGTGNAVSSINDFANVNFLTLAGDACPPAPVSAAVVGSQATSNTHHASPARPQ
jgi:parallel beta-helix repeat protein